MTGFLDAGGGGGGGSPPEADGPDGPERGSTPPDDDRQEVEGEPGPDPDLADDEPQDPDPATLERTLDQLRGGGGAAVDRDSVRLDSSDIPVAPGQWPLGFPIQGLPRAAVTFNLNFVYDDERDQWVRDTGNGKAGGHARLFETSGQTFPGNAKTQVSFDGANTTGGFRANPGDDTITAPANGRYILAAGCTVGGVDNNSSVNLFISVNGTAIAEGMNSRAPDGNASGTPSIVVELEAGDTVTTELANGTSSTVFTFAFRSSAYLSAGRL